MPLLLSKVYVLNKIKKDKTDDLLVLCQPLTNEICENAEELARKTFLYNQKIWTCKITGQINLTFKEAQKSEQGCGKMLKNSFMKCYESTVLQYVHHSKENLDNIIHRSWTQIHEEFSINEPVIIKLTSPKTMTLKGIIVKIDRSPKKKDADANTSPSKVNSSSSDKENIKKKIPIKKNYHYSVKLFDLDKIVNDIPLETIERTLRPPSKDHIRMFIRAHAIRHSGKPANNTWIVDEELVKKYKLPCLDPDFIFGKLKMKELSREVELQMYNKMMADMNKKEGDITVDLTKSDDEDEKKPRRSVDSTSSKKLKQMTLLDMRSAASNRSSTKIKSPFASPTRTIPPLAQQLLRVMKENKDDPSINHLVIRCCQYTDIQIARFPDLIRVPIKDKKEKLDLKKKLKNMTQEQRDAYFAERRTERVQLQRERKREILKCDEENIENTELTVEGNPLNIDEAITHDQWARLVSLSEFVRCFKGLLGPASLNKSGDLIVTDLCRAVIGETDKDRSILADLVCLFLKPLLQDAHLRQRKELGVALGEFPVTACTAGELLKLVLPMKETQEEEENEREADAQEDVDGKGDVVVKVHVTEVYAHSNMIAGPICDKLGHCEMDALSLEEKIVILELLQSRILELDIISSFIDEYQREATEAYKKRQTDLKELNDKLKVVRASMAEMFKLKQVATVEEVAETKVDDDVAPSVRRRQSLDTRVKETEERDRRLDLERQYQRMERDEINYKKMIDQAHMTYNTAINEAKQLLRVQPLGSDRLNRRYWLFKTAPPNVYVESEVGDAISEDGVTTTWSMFNSTEEIARLITALSERIHREGLLKKELQMVLPKLTEQFEAVVDDSCRSITANEESDEESFLVRGFKDELRETELNIRQGSLGGIDEYEEWEKILSESTDLGQMKEALVAVFLGVHERFWSGSLKPASGRNDFLTAVQEAETQSRLNVLQYFLDVCICWSKSASDDKCKVCHKNHQENSMLLCDGCNRAYHTFCLRPPLQYVPDGEWLCLRCKPANRAADVEAESQTQKARFKRVTRMVESCSVCGIREEGLDKCVGCGNLYHTECHEPPLRNMRRTQNWYCSSCRVEGKTKQARTQRSDDDDEEQAPKKTRRVVEKTNCKVSRLHTSASESEDDQYSAKKTQKKHAVNGRVKSAGTRQTRSNNALTESEEDDFAEVPSKEEKKALKETVEVNGKKRKSEKDPIEDKRQTRRDARSTEKSDKSCDESDQDVEDLASLLPGRTTRKRPAAVEVPKTLKRQKTITSRDEHANNCMKTILKQLYSHKASWPFRDAVDKEEVPDYYSIVSNPTDLSLLMDRQRKGDFSGAGGVEEFLEGISQLFTNADLYNEADSDVMKLAEDLEDFFVAIYGKCKLGVNYVREKSK